MRHSIYRVWIAVPVHESLYGFRLYSFPCKYDCDASFKHVPNTPYLKSLCGFPQTTQREKDPIPRDGLFWRFRGTALKFDGRARMKQDHDMETLAKRLREAREFLGMSQEYVAQQMNVPRPAISKIESGRRKVNSLELIRLSKLYGRPVGYLLGESQEEETFNTDPLAAKLRLMTRGLRAEDREEILHFIEFLRHRKTTYQTH